MQFGVGRATTKVSPEVEQALGRVAVSFGLVEFTLAALMADLIGGDVMVGRAVVAALPFRRRLDVLVAISRIRAPRFKEEDLQTLKTRLNDAENRRDQAFHSVFVGSGPEATPMRFKESTRQKDGYKMVVKEIDAATIRADADFIAGVAADVTRATGEIQLILGKPADGPVPRVEEASRATKT